MSDFSASDVTKLCEKLDAAIAAIPEVTYASSYPIYPKSLRNFTDHIPRSPWHRTDYVEDMKKNLDERIGTLTTPEVQFYLTFLIRVDRFSPGGLLARLKDDSAKRVVERATELVGE
jgi:hypothetical protein